MELIPKTKMRQMSRYRECMRNHAAKIGGHAVDGCGEYIPSPSSNPSDASSFMCAACGCHRNFHLRPHYGSGYILDEAEEEATGSDVLLSPKSLGEEKKNKRYRTKFSREQKEGMLELAERVGWRLQKKEDGLVEEACRRIGVTRAVFKIWMHNNKQPFLAAKSKVNSDEADVANGDDGGDGGGGGGKQQRDNSPPPAAT